MKRLTLNFLKLFFFPFILCFAVLAYLVSTCILICMWLDDKQNTHDYYISKEVRKEMTLDLIKDYFK